MTWLAAKFLGTPRWLWLIVGAAALALIANHMIDRTLDTAADAGATKQREADLTETIDRVEKGNETREQVKRELDAGRGAELYARCLRAARTPAHCERFLPQREADDR